jgi:hypothetical protein
MGDSCAIIGRKVNALCIQVQGFVVLHAEFRVFLCVSLEVILTPVAEVAGFRVLYCRQAEGAAVG